MPRRISVWPVAIHTRTPEAMGITNQHDLGAGLCRMGQHALQLARADHARLVEDKHIARGEQGLPPVKAVLSG